MLGWVRRAKKDEVETLPAEKTIPEYEAEIDRLEEVLIKIVAETEALARLKLVEWKIRKAEARKNWLLHGVRIPESPFEVRQGQLFHEMEIRIRNEEQKACEELERVEAEKIRKIEWDKESKLAEQRREMADAERRELERQKLAAQQQVATTIAQALRDDLG